MSEENFPYGAKPRFPSARKRFIKEAEAHIEGRRAFEKHMGRRSAKPIQMTVHPSDLLSALALEPVTQTSTFDGFVKQLLDKDLLREVNQRVTNGDYELASKMREVVGNNPPEEPTEQSDEALLDAVIDRLSDKDFARALGEALGERVVKWVLGRD